MSVTGWVGDPSPTTAAAFVHVFEAPQEPAGTSTNSSSRNAVGSQYTNIADHCQQFEQVPVQTLTF